MSSDKPSSLLEHVVDEVRAGSARHCRPHPNILALYDIGTHDGVPYLVTELLAGDTVRERIARGALPFAYTILNPSTNRDIGVLPLFGDRKPFLLVRSAANELHGQISPDGGWIAYESDESGDNEIYVQRFPSGGQKVRISTGGGRFPRWRQDGHELFYHSRTDGHLMAVRIESVPDRGVGTPTSLFATSMIAAGGLGTNATYDVSADGQRFIIASTLGNTDDPPITIVLNWSSLLAK